MTLGGSSGCAVWSASTLMGSCMHGLVCGVSTDDPTAGLMCTLNTIAIRPHRNDFLHLTLFRHTLTSYQYESQAIMWNSTRAANLTCRSIGIYQDDNTCMVTDWILTLHFVGLNLRLQVMVKLGGLTGLTKIANPREAHDETSGREPRRLSKPAGEKLIKNDGPDHRDVGKDIKGGIGDPCGHGRRKQGQANTAKATYSEARLEAAHVQQYLLAIRIATSTVS
ncbi:hypothetical protein EJ03DRAFT_333094 [Teratosphaeria nubilosa]|uniref:Uncharacterized protein n=1 Tax=Teratosphaeria nubilosa TaxID=161662 RepID=A0A6G1LLX4_9PEZI|nr:hypothetical protein EJ03DRAFT_333094 [Teratosphaeria nubilosa]